MRHRYIPWLVVVVMAALIAGMAVFAWSTARDDGPDRAALGAAVIAGR